MGYQQPFTDSVNFRRLAGMIQASGHDDVPEKEPLLALVRKSDETQFVDWAIAQAASDWENFKQSLQFHMQKM